MRPKILLVDDEPEVLTLLDYALSAAGFDVTTASTGAFALELTNSMKPDVILLDIKLPDLDGFSVCEMLRARARLADCPVILYSSHGGIAVRARSLEAGSQHFVSKSEGINALVHCLRTTLQNRDATPNAAM